MRSTTVAFQYQVKLCSRVQRSELPLKAQVVDGEMIHDRTSVRNLQRRLAVRWRSIRNSVAFYFSLSSIFSASQSYLRIDRQDFMPDFVC
jgi:hypothetical protein